ncbi:hypothetical protein TEA_016561 [Camellia sinensis var. sinensis]|uniref:Uncharacterized protein n=1 Tax=Camellia sinensis var. sinensis TaxID=542762 RepID=A0A4S4D717_CAMSN|nr:hypothetical protein TEA_016561 [Camellia sinensis var. sinensis]
MGAQEKSPTAQHSMQVRGFTVEGKAYFFCPRIEGCSGILVSWTLSRYGTVTTAIAVATADTPVNLKHTAKAAVTGGVFEKTDTFSMAKPIFSYIDQAYEELFDDAVRPRKNLHALVSHLYPPLFIQVMEVFGNHRPLNQEPAAYDSLEHKFTIMDIGSSSSTAKPSAWDEVAASSVVYPYVSIDRIRSLEDNLLSSSYTSTLPSQMVRSVQRPGEALGTSDWLECVARPEFLDSIRNLRLLLLCLPIQTGLIN